METIEISTVQLYRLLVGNLRYAYSRNNHLMPSCAYSEAKEILNKILQKDKDTAINTAKQLCEECISDQLAKNFSDGLDDEFGNRKEAIEFINDLLDFAQEDHKEWKPYNYSLYENNIKKENELKYTLFELTDTNIDFESFDNDILISDNKNILASNISRKEADDILFDDILKDDKETISFNKVSLIARREVIGHKFRIISPEKSKGKIYCIVLSNELARAEFEKIEHEGL